ncbi:hypothetical protein [Salinithrix halophila]|uniref:Phage protein n=1 Tax=Salinithrix halophila TaxID=1485204 RepID=A0ABV8JBM6_9BACL
MSRIKIDMAAPIQEFEIGGKVYKLDYSDDKLKQYHAASNKFINDYDEALKMDVEKMSEKEQKAAEEKYTQSVKDTVDLLFGSGSFDMIYEDCGRSMFNVGKVLEAVYSFIGDKLGVEKTQKKKKYTRK